MNEEKNKIIKRRVLNIIFFCIAVYLVIYIQAPLTYFIASLRSYGYVVTFNMVYYISCVIAVICLGRFWWLFPLLYWVPFYGFIVSTIDSYERYGNKSRTRRRSAQSRNGT